MILYMRPANGRRCYIVASFLGWEHIQNHPCRHNHCFGVCLRPIFLTSSSTSLKCIARGPNQVVPCQQMTMHQQAPGPLQAECWLQCDTWFCNIFCNLRFLTSFHWSEDIIQGIQWNLTKCITLSVKHSWIIPTDDITITHTDSI